MLTVSVPNILDKLSDSIDFLQPLREAITNSIEANATNIDVVFAKEQTLLDEEDYKAKITGFTIVDNGVGFTEENRNSFSEYWSKYKLNLGCKGVGRFTWLKVFGDIKIESFTKKEKVNIDFNKSFSENEDAIQTTPNVSSDTKTTITLSNVTSKYYDKDKDLRKNAVLKEIKDDIKKHLSVYFFLWKKKKKKKNKIFNITLQIDEETETISNDKVQLKEEVFSVKEDFENTKIDFNLYYDIFKSGNKGTHDLFYCANGRTVMKFSEDIRFKDLPDDSSSIFLLTSKYFDERINDDRNEFTFDFKEDTPDLVNPLPMPKINNELKNRVNNILIEKYPRLEEANKNIIDDCINENPYLAKYIRTFNCSIFPDKEAILKKAECDFKKEKEDTKNKFVRMLASNEIDTDEFQENIYHLNTMCNRELAQYFHYRQSIIDALNKLNKKNDKHEKLLHNLFMRMGTISDKSDTDNATYSNNIWLLDDKYMSYTKAFSDESIKKIRERMMTEPMLNSVSAKKPDLAIFYNENGTTKYDVVVVELKAVGASTDKKMVSIPEINRNLGLIAEEIGDIKNIKTLYGYIITHLDEGTIKDLRVQQGVHELFAVGDKPIFYYYNDNIKDKKGNAKPCHTYILSTETLYQDANARNKVFLDIVKNAD